MPDPRWGEAGHAVSVLKPGAAAIDAAAIKAHCQSLIAGYKCPRSVDFRDALPLSGAGKVLKTVLREPWWRESERKVGCSGVAHAACMGYFGANCSRLKNAPMSCARPTFAQETACRY